VVNAALPGGACFLPLLSAPPTVSFGNVIVGNPSTQTVTLSGAGTGSTTISQATVSGTGFSLSGPSLPLTLTVGQSANFSVTFAPLTAGNANGAITFVSNPPNGAINSPVTETLAGTGVNTHYVSLAWQASTSPNVVGYNVFRATSSSGPFTTPLNSSLVAGLSYTDSTVLAGQTYYYVATAVDSSNNQSADSSPPAQATVPSP
ncbi:MAG: choice-of-anchor D domain-containing protein, partial [Bryobacteraceae bacterium]